MGRVNIAQEEPPEVLEWLMNASSRGGSFVSHFATACLFADAWNYQHLRGVVHAMMNKYPQYRFSQELHSELERDAADRETRAIRARFTISRAAQSVRTWFRRMVE